MCRGLYVSVRRCSGAAWRARGWVGPRRALRRLAAGVDTRAARSAGRGSCARGEGGPGARGAREHARAPAPVFCRRAAAIHSSARALRPPRGSSPRHDSPHPVRRLRTRPYYALRKEPWKTTLRHRRSPYHTYPKYISNRSHIIIVILVNVNRPSTAIKLRAAERALGVVRIRR